jgi:L-rhamnose mutarotase
MKKYVLALDLKDDEKLIAEYEAYHREVWPEIIESIRNSGIQNLEIYRTGNRMAMVMEVSEYFTFEAKSAADIANKKVQEWEALMWQYQQALPLAKPGEKWILMDCIFSMK